MEFILPSPETKKHDPWPDLRQNNQFHCIVANPEGLFPSLILHLARLRDAGL